MKMGHFLEGHKPPQEAHSGGNILKSYMSVKEIEFVIKNLAVKLQACQLDW